MSGLDIDVPRPMPDVADPFKNPGEPINPGGELTGEQLKAGLNDLTISEDSGKLDLFNRFKIKAHKDIMDLFEPEKLAESSRKIQSHMNMKLEGLQGEALPDPAAEAYFAALQAEADARVSSVMAQLAAGEKIDPDTALDAGMFFAGTRPGSVAEGFVDQKKILERYLSDVGINLKNMEVIRNNLSKIMNLEDEGKSGVNPEPKISPDPIPPTLPSQQTEGHAQTDQ